MRRLLESLAARGDTAGLPKDQAGGDETGEERGRELYAKRLASRDDEAAREQQQAPLCHQPMLVNQVNHPRELFKAKPTSPSFARVQSMNLLAFALKMKPQPSVDVNDNVVL